MRTEWLGKPAGAGPGGFYELDGKIYYGRSDGEVVEVSMRDSAE